MSEWTDFLAEVEKNIVPAAQAALLGFADEAKTDAQAFIDALGDDLKTWTQELAEGKIGADAFGDFVRADADLAKMAALTAAGVAAADLQRFRDTLVNVVINAAIGAFKV